MTEHASMQLRVVAVEVVGEWRNVVKVTENCS